MNLCRFSVCRGPKSLGKGFWHQALFLHSLWGRLVLGFSKPRRGTRVHIFFPRDWVGPFVCRGYRLLWGQTRRTISFRSEWYTLRARTSLFWRYTGVGCHCLLQEILLPHFKEGKTTTQAGFADCLEPQTQLEESRSVTFNPTPGCKAHLEGVTERPLGSWSCDSAHTPHQCQLHLPSNSSLCHISTASPFNQRAVLIKHRLIIKGCI